MSDEVRKVSCDETLDELTVMFANLLRNGLVTRDDLITQGHTSVAAAIMNPSADQQQHQQWCRSPLLLTAASRKHSRDDGGGSDDEESDRAPSPLPLTVIGAAGGVEVPPYLFGRAGLFAVTGGEGSLKHCGSKPSACRFDESDVRRSASIAHMLTGSEQGPSSEREDVQAFEE